MRNESGAARRGRVDHQTDRDESPNSGGGGVALTEDSIGKAAGRQAVDGWECSGGLYSRNCNASALSVGGLEAEGPSARQEKGKEKE